MISPSAIISEYVSRVPLDLKGMISDLGLNLEFASLGPDIAGKLVRDPTAAAGFRVVVNTRDNPARQRFTMAHEVAHYALHRDLIADGVVDDALYRSALSDGFEREADRFAAQILLPATSLREAYRTQKALAPLSQVFGVSVDALRIRLNELGLGV
jgi:predicted transcriptional regulator